MRHRWRFAELGLGAAIVRSVDIARDDLRKIYGVSLLFGAGMTAALVAAPRFSLVCSRSRDLRGPSPAHRCRSSSARLRLFRVRWRPATCRSGASPKSKWLPASPALLRRCCSPCSAQAYGLSCLETCSARLHAAPPCSTLGERVWPLFSLRGIGEHLKFGLTLAGNRVSYFIVVQSDVLIGSAFLSTTEIGQYSVALQLATLPMAKVMGTINQITLPAVARQQGDRPAFVRLC